MFNKLFKSVAATAIVLLLFAPLPLFAQEENSTSDDSTYDLFDYEYNYDDTGYTFEYSGTNEDLTDEEAAALLGTLAVFAGVWFTIALGIAAVGYVYGSWTLMVIGGKLKEEQKWMAWVPVLNLYYMFKVAGLNPWLFLLSFIPFVNIIAFVIVMIKIAERRGFPSWIGFLFLVPVANIILPGYLAWANPPKAK